MDEISEDGFWQLVDGEWAPSELQTKAISKGAVPHVDTTETKVITNPEYDSSTNHSLDEANNNFLSGRKPLIFGTGGIVIAVTLIILFSMISPGTVSLLDDMKDSDGDGISDSDELKEGTNPENRDSDNDGLDDDLDSCPIGEINWESTIVTDFDSDGCQDKDEDLDDDNDGILDLMDSCDTSEVGWVSTFPTDNDGDGCHDDGDADDDNDGWSDSKESQCGTNPLSFSSMPLDFDNDMVCNIVDPDDDNDGIDDVEDLFPFDSLEWVDFDGDGIGDNADLDDDGDEVPDIYDLNPNRDAALYLNLDMFTVHEYMDYFDSYAEVYFCVYVNQLDHGCIPDQNSYWSLLTGTTYSIDTSIFIDLNESVRYHTIQIVAWDSDAWDDDLIDISSDSDMSSHIFVFDSVTSLNNQSFVADGTLDSTGWDGELEYSLSPFDSRGLSIQNYLWDFQGDWYSLDWTLDYSTYAQSRALPHDIDWSGATSLPDVIDQYAAFAVIDQQYVIDLANELKNMAIQAGYISELEIAEFIFAFVGDIQYQLDSIEHGEQEYPKYPIEMLWEQNGDCEDAALLFISLTESIGYDSALMIGEVKSSSDEDWSGHAWAVIYMPDHSGDGWYGFDEKSDLPFYFVEATAHYDGNSQIGVNPWYDVQNFGFYDVE